MELVSSFFSNLLSLPFLVAAVATALCFLFGLFTTRSVPFLPAQKRRESSNPDGSAADSAANCDRSYNGTTGKSDSVSYLNGCVGGMMQERAAPAMAERQTGASIMEQLVPEIRTHALSYLDYPSLCRLSMTNSSMRKAANDDNAWKALYHKDFTLEQGDITPINGWKAYYAATRAIVNVNSEFFDIIRARSLPAMRLMWLKEDYVTCVHISGESFSGYNAVIQSWQIPFNWQHQQPFDFQVRDVKARVLTDMAWVTMKLYVDMETDPVNVTNVFEFHKGVWYMVHHHISLLQQIVNG